MNPQPKPSPGTPDRLPAAPMRQGHRVPAGPRAFLTWPVEFEVEPWRP